MLAESGGPQRSFRKFVFLATLSSCPTGRSCYRMNLSFPVCFYISWLMSPHPPFLSSVYQLHLSHSGLLSPPPPALPCSDTTVDGLVSSSSSCLSFCFIAIGGGGRTQSHALWYGISKRMHHCIQLLPFPTPTLSFFIPFLLVLLLQLVPTSTLLSHKLFYSLFLALFKNSPPITLFSISQLLTYTYKHTHMYIHLFQLHISQGTNVQGI